ncbi:velvet factor [Fomitopsis betulina]|nr:velvet factor [Fomitopsis betulina]
MSAQSQREGIYSMPPLVSRPVMFSMGPFAGRNILVQLVEVQQADRGRKWSTARCGNIDVRPIDPPPIVHLKIFQVHNIGTPRQREVELQQITEAESYGWMCHVDLFPMPTDPAGAGGFRTANQPQPSGAPSAPSPMAASRPSGGASDRITPTGPSSSVRSTPYGAELIPGRRTTSSQHVDDPSDAVVARVRGVPVLERSKRTVDLVGNTFSPCTCSKGKLIFAFTNLAVREEGVFFLRYRTFNTVYMAMGDTPLPVLAECVGGSFTIYPTNGFPGLNPSTALTKARLISFL